MKPLSPKLMLYVQHRALGKPCAAAARAAGYRAGYARNAAQKLECDPRVKAELDKVRAALGEKTKYTLERAIEELDYRIERADAAEQHTAVSSMMQAKLKMHGYLADKLQLEAGPDLAGALAAARARVYGGTLVAALTNQSTDVVDVQAEPAVDPFS